jgi:hypothetical protein
MASSTMVDMAEMKQKAEKTRAFLIAGHYTRAYISFLGIINIQNWSQLMMRAVMSALMSIFEPPVLPLSASLTKLVEATASLDRDKQTFGPEARKIWARLVKDEAGPCKRVDWVKLVVPSIPATEDARAMLLVDWDWKCAEFITLCVCNFSNPRPTGSFAGEFCMATAFHSLSVALRAATYCIADTRPSMFYFLTVNTMIVKRRILEFEVFIRQLIDVGYFDGARYDGSKRYPTIDTMDTPGDVIYGLVIASVENTHFFEFMYPLLCERLSSRAAE